MLNQNHNLVVKSYGYKKYSPSGLFDHGGFDLETF